MGSRYKGIDLFGSGPHRFRPEPLGQALVAFEPLAPGTGWIGLGNVKPSVTVEGYLVGADEAAVREALETIRAELLLWPEAGLLVNHAGHEWADMVFGRFTPGGVIEQGRVASLKYAAFFYREG